MSYTHSVCSLCGCRDHFVYLLDKLLQAYKPFAERASPVEGFERKLHKVACLYVAIHAHIVENILQVSLLFGCQVVAFYKLLVYLQSLVAVYSVDYTYECRHIILIRMAVGKLVVLVLRPEFFKEYALQFLDVSRRELLEVLYLA